MPAQASCGAAFCPINTSWDVLGRWAEPGARFDLRYEAITQDQPRAGTRNLGVGEIPRHHDEVRTRNRNWIATFDYAFSADWGLSASLPLVDRDHEHIHNHRGAKLLETWGFTAAGDARVLGRYGQASGVNFGLKLPTGDFSVRNSANQLAERSLQPGTGTTDLLLGAYTAGDLPWQGASWFTQALLQLPLNERGGYKPGERIGVDGGLRYDIDDRWSLMLQANLLWRGKDSGRQAEPADTGGTALWIGPGVSYGVTRDLRLYAYVQAPLYQYVNGVQLVAAKAGVVGVSARF
jgi:hypothetical protein